MTQDTIRSLIEPRLTADGLTPTALPGVSLFRATQAIPCVPAVYDPCVIAIVSGAKEAVVDGTRLVYDSDRYLLCPMAMPLTAGTPNASEANPLFGVLITVDTRAMTDLAMELQRTAIRPAQDIPSAHVAGIRLARWGDAFSDALLRIVQLCDDDTDAAILGQARLRELYYAILKGDAGPFARRAFSPSNAIARSIDHLAANLSDPQSIDELADRAGLSRAVFHRRFKEATAMSPIQFVKSMRLNNAAMNIAQGMSVAQAAFEVGYVSPSQFSREFKRAYGQTPKRWTELQTSPVALT